VPGAAGTSGDGDLTEPWVVRGVRPGNSSTPFEPRREERDIMKNLFARFIKEEEGQDLIEYALLAGFISLAATAVLVIIGPNLATLYTNVNTQITGAGS
jgi:pilus assembly protein Flp/PilA